MDKVSRLSQRLQLNKFKLSSLLEITKGINANLPIDELLKIYREILQSELAIERLALFSKSESGWMPLLEYGHKVDLNQVTPHQWALNYTDITVLTSPDDQVLSNYDVLIPVHHNDVPLAFLLIGDLDEEEIAISPTIKHMNFIQTLTNILVVAVENKRLVKESLEQERVKRELELAAEMQAMLVPNILPSDDIIDVDALYFPHQQVGGDYYDYIRTADGRHVLCIADVSGKGVPAAFLMANFQARLRTMVENDESIEKLIHGLNQGVIDAAQGDKFITFFITIYEPKNRLMTYINAGHNPPLLICDGKTSWLEKGCVGLGMLDDIPVITNGEVTLSKDAVLITFTDGLVEMENESQEEYGYDRIEKIVRDNFDSAMSLVNGELIKDFDEFRDGSPAQDDIALLSVRFL